MKGRNHTVSLLYEAAMNPSLWPNALAAFADLTQCRDVVLSVIDKKRGKPRLFLSGCRIFTPEAMRDYLTKAQDITLGPKQESHLDLELVQREK